MATMVTVHASPIVLVGCADRETSEGLSAILESWHYAVEVTASGREALDRLIGPTPPTMALLDMDLPAPGGTEIAAELRRRREPRPGWVVLLSRVASRERVRLALESGCRRLSANSGRRERSEGADPGGGAGAGADQPGAEAVGGAALSRDARRADRAVESRGAAEPDFPGDGPGAADADAAEPDAAGSGRLLARESRLRL